MTVIPGRAAADRARPGDQAVMRRVLPGLITAGAILLLGGPTLGAQTESPQHPARATLSGRVTLILPPKVTVDPGGSVVWIPGLNLARTETPSLVTSRDKRFEPRILAVSRGTRIRFPNVDSIYHNAFSLSPGNAFDLGLYRKGAFREIEMRTPGIVRVYCNIHPDMAASVLVVEGNAFATVGTDGAYRIEGIPAGRHDVHIWSDLAGEQVASLVLEPGRATDWSPALDATTYRRVAHLNKHGKAYPKATSDADRY